MAKETKEVVEKQKDKATDEKESKYSIDEFASNSNQVFGTRPECVVAALKSEGAETYTISEAKNIVKKFLEKEVN